MDKQRIHTRLLSLEAHELEDTREAYEGYVASAHIPVSGAIDDQDQSQAVQARNLSEALEGPLGAAKSTAIIWKPKTQTPIAGDDVATLMKLIDALDDDDDVQTVFSNEDISDEDLAKLG